MSLPTPSATPTWPQPMQRPAYNTVPMPRTSSQPSDPGAPRKVEWTDPVRNYVRNAFEPINAIAGISNEDMQKKLKETIGYFAQANMLESIDWDTYPLPQKLLQEEREKAAAALLNRGPSTQYAVSNGNANSPASPHPKKRKSQDPDELQAQQSQSSVPPWQKTNLESRMTFGEAHNDKRQKKNATANKAFSKFDQADLEKRRHRFQLGQNGSKTTPPWSSPRKTEDDEASTAIIIGTNTNLEKSYFRLTAPPKPDTVRPLHILEQTLAMLKRKWKEEKNYNYICNQFKSLRQDLTVQHIKTAFTVKVYETHARIALEKGDQGEYNQCQTQLKALYAQGLDGRPDEFKAYRILYFVYTCNTTGMNDMLAELTPADKSQRFIKHALDVRSALALGNYHKFFQLYVAAENMGSYLMDMFLERERLNALANMSKGYKIIALPFLAEELGFDSVATCREFLESHDVKDFIEEKIDDQNKRHLRVKIWDAGSVLERLRAAAFRKVDIKGQI